MKTWAKKTKSKPPVVEPEDRGHTHAFGSYIIVFIAPGQPENEAVGTIIHESVHVFQEAMKFVGEAKAGDEVEAYNIEQIATNLLKDYYALDD